MVCDTEQNVANAIRTAVGKSCPHESMVKAWQGAWHTVLTHQSVCDNQAISPDPSGLPQAHERQVTQGWCSVTYQLWTIHSDNSWPIRHAPWTRENHGKFTLEMNDLACLGLGLH